MFLRALSTSPSSSSGTGNAIGSLLDGFPRRWPISDLLSSLKWVRDERQRQMKCETHRTAVMLHYNGGLQ